MEKELIEKKIDALTKVGKLYEELVKKNPKCSYRLNAIEVILDTLYELKDGKVDADEWMQCYLEDMKEHQARRML